MHIGPLYKTVQSHKQNKLITKTIGIMANNILSHCRREGIFAEYFIFEIGNLLVFFQFEEFILPKTSFMVKKEQTSANC